MKYLALILSIFLFVSCDEAKSPASHSEVPAEKQSTTIIEDTIPPQPDNAEAQTLLGDYLFTPTEFSELALTHYEKAKQQYKNQPENADSLIWHGRRTAYLGKFKAAIQIYTEGIAKHPADARFYRHRGHRYISTRQYEKAIEDFEKAVNLIEGQEDKVEPDGLPNAQNIPLTTLHSNIWYHLGLAYYLTNKLEKALEAFQNRAVTQKYDDNIVSGAHWQYMILRRLGRVKEAKESISEITKEMEIIENISYHQMCLFYKGLIAESDLTNDQLSSSASDVLTYGLLNWYMYDQQDNETAFKMMQDLYQNGNPYSFAYLASEADWARLGWVDEAE
ncbi:MAG: tetratricopeptide repeat protein [Bacteroidota bacterium]